MLFQIAYYYKNIYVYIKYLYTYLLYSWSTDDGVDKNCDVFFNDDFGLLVLISVCIAFESIAGCEIDDGDRFGRRNKCETSDAVEFFL